MIRAPVAHGLGDGGAQNHVLRIGCIFSLSKAPQLLLCVIVGHPLLLLPLWVPGLALITLSENLIWDILFRA